MDRLMKAITMLFWVGVAIMMTSLSFLTLSMLK
jgi:hypothetical protein